MLTPYTERQKAMIANNIIKACKDITKLNKQAYKFLYLCSGFIAHYNHQGFIATYEDGSLKDDILRNVYQNQWYNFREGERDYEYMMSKKDIYNRVVEKIS